MWTVRIPPISSFRVAGGWGIDPGAAEAVAIRIDDHRHTWRACNEPVPQPAVLDRAGAGRRAARTAAAGRPGLRAGALPRPGVHDHLGGRAAGPVRRAIRALAGVEGGDAARSEERRVGKEECSKG